jgi:hypothetical protein
VEHKDKITIALSAAAVSLALGFGVVNSYYLFFRGPHTQLNFAPTVFFVGSDLIGIGCTFSNRGGQQDTINFVSAEIAGENRTLRPIWVATTTHQWVLERGRREKVIHDPQFTDFTPISIPAKGSETRIIWFTSDSGYQFQAHDYQLIVKGFGSNHQDLRTQAILDFSISPDDKKTIEKDPDLEFSIRGKPWMMK